MPTARLKLDNPTAGNRTKGTISCWFKRSGLSSNQWIYSERLNSTDYAGVRINSGDNIGIFSYNGGSAEIDANTNAKFRDTSAWYHFVANWDTSLATASDRVKIWINGELQSFSGSPSYPSQNSNTKFGIGSPSGNNYAIVIGRRGDNAEYFDGSMAHYHRVDNQTLAPTVFGETDSTTGIWKPITSPSITYTGSASHNFFLDFASSSDMGNDISGNNNDLTVSGTITQTIDTPSNVFATFLPVPRIGGGSPVHPTFSNGNTTAYFDNASYNENAISSLAMNSGKYYWEVKCTNAISDGSGYVGIVDLASYDNGFVGNQCVAYRDNGQKINDNTSTSYGNTFTSGDIIGVAFDASTGTIWFSKNGTWQNSATKSEIEAGTTTNSAYTGLSTSTFWHTLISNYNDRYASINFGNGYFGTTAVSSAGTNAGIGTFEYDVPSGYKALCTKNINAQEYS